MLTLRRMRRDAGGIVLLAVVAAGLVMWAVHPPSTMAARTIPTGASFNIAVSQPREYAHARAVAAGIERSGLPAFTRTLRGGTQVIVGPFVDLEEADRAQRRLAARGYAARLIVDESVRRAPGFGGIPTVGTGVQVLLVSGAGRLSVVMELPVEPREFSSRRVSPDLLEVTVGPAPAGIARQRWHTPAGVELLDEVLVEEIGVGSGRVLRTRLSVSESTLTNVRTLGRRLYIDLWPGNGIETRALAARKGPPYGSEVVGRAFTARRDTLAARQDPPYNLQIAPALARFQSMEPFVLSAVASPSPDVLTALETSLKGLESWIRGIQAPAEGVQMHTALETSVRLAKESVDPVFTGDRSARAREAFELLGVVGRALSGSPSRT